MWSDDKMYDGTFVGYIEKHKYEVIRFHTRYGVTNLSPMTSLIL